MLMNTWLGRTWPSAAASDALSSRSAATGITPSCAVGLRASPATVQPSSTSSRAVALPTIPVVPTTKAVFVINSLLGMPARYGYGRARGPGGTAFDQQRPDAAQGLTAAGQGIARPHPALVRVTLMHRCASLPSSKASTAADS